MCLIFGWGRSPGEEKGNLLQYSCLENPMDREAWQATVHGVTKQSDMIEQLSTHRNLKGQGKKRFTLQTNNQEKLAQLKQHKLQ